MIRDVRLRAASDDDMEAMTRVLEACGLALSGACEVSRLYHVAKFGRRMVGCAYGELHGRTFAIHTVAVLPEFRGRHLATYIVSALLMRARAGGCSNATVLTNEHPGFFARHGFTLTSVDTLVRETQLSLNLLRSFGPRTHYMARQLN